MLVKNMWNYAYNALTRILCIFDSLVKHEQGGLTFNIIFYNSIILCIEFYAYNTIHRILCIENDA